MVSRKYISHNDRVIITACGASVYDPINIIIESVDIDGYFEPGNRCEFQCPFDDIELYYAPPNEYRRVA